MKRIYLSLIVLVSGWGAMAQQDFYIFIQEPSHQPFYVRMAEENHSSSPEGHLILSKLRDSVYNLYIGFPRSRNEQMFTISINRKDHGYELRNNNGRRQLFDLQTLQLINPVATAQTDGQTIRKNDSYSELMAGVVDDSAVLYTSPQDTLTTDTALGTIKPDSAAVVVRVAKGSKGKKGKVAKVKTDTVKVETDTVKVKTDTVKVETDTAKVKTDTAKVKTDTVETKKDAAVSAKADSAVVKMDSAGADRTKINKDTLVAVSVVAAQPDSSVRDKRDIIRLSTENVAEGRLMIYVDRTGPVSDTIRIIIPKRL